jgi:tetratricopeptide (TPR) repeat protein
METEHRRPLRARDAIRRAEEAIQTEPARRALRIIESLQGQFPGEPRLHRLSAHSLERLGRRVEAELEYRRAILGAPEDADAALDLAELILEQGRAREAERLARRVLRRCRDSYRAEGIRAEALRALGHLDAAERALRHAIELDPDFAWAGRELSELLCLRGEFREARETLSKLLDRDPLDPYNYGFFGDVLRRTNRPVEAIEAFRTALFLHPSYAWAARQLATIQAEQGALRAVSAPPKGPEVQGAAGPDPWIYRCLYSIQKRFVGVKDGSVHRDR